MESVHPISQVPLFMGLLLEQMREICRISQEAELSAGEFVFDEGDPAKNFYVLLDGKISLRVHLTSNPKTVTVGVISKPYQGFGWSGIVAPHFFTASAYCERDTRILAIKGEPLLDILKQDTDSGFVVMQRVANIISERLRHTRSALLKTL